MIEKILNRLRAQRDDERGSAIVELVIALPMLVLILFGIIEISLLFFLQNEMVIVARDTARRLAANDITEAEAETLAENMLFSWDVDFTINASVPAPTDPNSVSVFISVPFAQAAMMDYTGLLGDGTLETVAIMPIEP